MFHVKWIFCYRKQLELKIIPQVPRIFAFSNNFLSKFIVLCCKRERVREGEGGVYGKHGIIWCQQQWNILELLLRFYLVGYQSSEDLQMS